MDKAKLIIGLVMDSFQKSNCFMLNPKCKVEEPQMHSSAGVRYYLREYESLSCSSSFDIDYMTLGNPLTS